MKNLKKVLVIAAAGAICLSNSSLATDALGTTSSFSGKKMLLLAIAVVATILVLYMSYKSDSPSELKPRTKAKKEDKLKDELLEKDNTYEVEEDEVYEDDKISPVSIGKDEDEISLFESVNNPDTEREEEEEEEIEEEIEEDSSVGFITRSNVGESKISNREKFKAMSEISNPEETVNDFFSDDEVIEESEEVEEEYNYDAVEENESNTESDSGTMVFNSTELNSKINIFEETEDETENESTEEESDDDEYNYNYDFDFEDKKEEVVEEEEEVSNETDEDLFEDVEETPTEFVGFTTIKPQTKTRGNSRFERPNYSRDSEAELNKAVKEMEEKVSKEEEENSSDDFLAQMAKNLGGKIEEKETPKKKATVAKKTTAAKSTSGTAKKTSTTTAAKKTTTKKTTKK